MTYIGAHKFAPVDTTIWPYFGLSMWRGMVRRPLSVMEIVTNISTQYNMTLDEIRSNDRHKRISWPRHHAMCAAADAGFSNCAIGRFFGKDHTTVRTGIIAHRLRIAYTERQHV